MVTFALPRVHFEQFPANGGPCGVVAPKTLRTTLTPLGVTEIMSRGVEEHGRWKRHRGGHQ
jgi:hypothetical protein